MIIETGIVLLLALSSLLLAIALFLFERSANARIDALQVNYRALRERYERHESRLVELEEERDVSGMQ